MRQPEARCDVGHSRSACSLPVVSWLCWVAALLLAGNGSRVKKCARRTLLSSSRKVSFHPIPSVSLREARKWSGVFSVSSAEKRQEGEQPHYFLSRNVLGKNHRCLNEASLTILSPKNTSARSLCKIQAEAISISLRWECSIREMFHFDAAPTGVALKPQDGAYAIAVS